jgi:hypothetical protein
LLTSDGKNADAERGRETAHFSLEGEFYLHGQEAALYMTGNHAAVESVESNYAFLAIQSKE